ncbi:MAG: class I SAM-dependent methyltransferase [Candidatus Zixiibacteriota bacterium]
MTDFFNAYEDRKMAEAYAKLEFPGTYYLAFRDLPEIIGKHATGARALDFGCGAGRSSRFVERLGFTTTGVDISESMLALARQIDPAGDYRLISEDGFQSFPNGAFDLIQSAFTFDNIPTREQKLGILQEIKRLLALHGRFVNLVSAPEIYWYEWASFSTKDFPDNRNAKCGEIVKIINTDIADSRPVDDIIWPDADYRELFAEVGLEVEAKYNPLARAEDPIQWVNETRIAPWSIYVLKSAANK